MLTKMIVTMMMSQMRQKKIYNYKQSELFDETDKKSKPDEEIKIFF